MNPPRLPWRRVAAFGLDYLVILLCMGVLALFSLSVLIPRLSLGAPWQTQLLGFTTLTLPVFLYFALSETRFAGTLGKRWLALSVTDVSGARVSLRQSLLRSALKFAPWELTHTAVHRFIFWTADGASLSFRERIFVVSVCTLSLGLAAAYLTGLFRGRPLYDRAVHTDVGFAHFVMHHRRLT